MKNKDKWWLTKDVIKINSSHPKTFILGIKIGFILGQALKIKERNEKTNS